jgi:hypothetical protein
MLTCRVASFTKPDPEASDRPSDGAVDLARQRAELAAILESETFRRSPKVSRLLSYLCDKYFRGEAEEIGEYGIAVDVLGRGTQFDPQVDAIVRVDTHHLRKRLTQYYAAEGQHHEVQIVIPGGQYTPKFVPRSKTTPQSESRDQAKRIEDVEAKSVAVEPIEPPAAVRKWPWIAGVAIASIVSVLSGIAYSRKPVTAAATITPTIAGPIEGDEIRILAGDDRGEYVDKAGRTWLSDRYFTGGAGFRRASHAISRTADPTIFEAGREGQFAYEIPLKPGVYELRLYLAETGVVSEALRGVNVAINGIPLSTLDVASDAGGIDTATVKIFEDISPAKDGILHLTFQGDPGFVNALEILHGIKGKMQPIRFSAGDSVFRDHLGRIWMPDQGFAGGRKSSRSTKIEGTEDPGLYLTQRYGHFTYSIPVVENGRYMVTLHFAETWFGKTVGGVGSRVFDVYCNGTTLLKNFDILKEGGGVGGRPVVKIFRNLAASPQGKLELTFVPVANYALISAIEVIQE